MDSKDNPLHEQNGLLHQRHPTGDSLNPKRSNRVYCNLSETFINNHIEELPAKVVMVHGWRPKIGDRTVLSWPRLLFHKAWRTLSNSGLESETTAAYLRVFRQHRVEAVLAEYGETGVLTVEACRRSRIPLIVHFHGYDASVRSVLEEHAQTYPRMFAEAAAVVAVSHAMRAKLISLGAPAEKVHYNPCGRLSALCWWRTCKCGSGVCRSRAIHRKESTSNYDLSFRQGAPCFPAGFAAYGG